MIDATGITATCPIRLGFALSGSLATPAAAPAVMHEKPASISDRLYFGRDIPAGGQVTETQWTDFLAPVVTLRFPGFVLELIQPDMPEPDRGIAEVIVDYKRRCRPGG